MHKERVSESISIGGVTPKYSTARSLHRDDSCVFQWVYTNGAGTGVVQVSCDGTNWDDLTDTTSPTFSGTGSHTFDVYDTAVMSVRIKFTSGSTMSGTLHFASR